MVMNNEWNDVESGEVTKTTKEYDHGRRMTITGGKGNDTIRNTFINMPDSYNDSYEDNWGDGEYHTITRTGYLKDAETYVTTYSNSNSDGSDYYKSNAISTLVFDRTFVYAEGDGNDVIEDYHEGETIVISGTYTTIASISKGNDVVISIDSGSITLNNARGKKITVTDDKGQAIDINSGSSPVDTSATLPAGLTWNSSKSGFIVADAYKGALDLSAYNTLNVVDADASGRSKALSLSGNAYNNSLVGGKGKDTINGGAGNDTIKGGAGVDNLTGGAGDDVFLYANGDGNDVITDFGTGNDLFKITDSAVSAVTKKKSDVILTVGKGKVTFKDAATKTITIEDKDGNRTSVVGGVHTIVNSASNKSVTGLAGADSIVSAAGTSKATLNGGAGNDTLSNLGSANYLNGDAGNDVIILGGSNSTVNGGAGNDTIQVVSTGNTIVFNSKNSGKDVITNYTDGAATIHIDSIADLKKVANGGKKAPNDVVFTIGKGTLTIKDGAGKLVNFVDDAGKTTSQAFGASAITITDSFSDTVDVSKDASVLVLDGSSRTKAVTLIGNAKANTIQGGSGDDELTGGKGKDTFIFSGGNDTITDYQIGQDTIKLNGTVTNLKYIGEKSTDLVITTNNGSLTIENAASLKSKKGVIITTPQRLSIIDSNGLTTAQIYNLSTVEGGINTMSGGSAADTLYGFTGDNILTGGKGKDVFIYGAGNDTITDYTAKQDKIQLSGATIASYVVEDKDVIFSFKDSNDKLTVTNGKNKAITIIDASGKETSETYNDKTELVLTKADSGKYDMNDSKYSEVKKVDATKTTKGVELIASANGTTLMGGKGKDVLTGGAGVDTFVYTTGGGNDTIKSYEAQDFIKLGAKTSISKAVVEEVKDSAGKVTHANYVFTIGKGKLTVESGATKTVTFVDDDGNNIKYNANYELPTATTNFEERIYGELFSDDNFATDELSNIIESNNIIANDNDYTFKSNTNFGSYKPTTALTTNKLKK